jgi:Kef-type K+ transport system membrane component KefB
MSAARDIVLVLVLGSLMQAVHGFAPDTERIVGSSVVLAFGFVLLTSWLAGRLFSKIGLPKLTGYLVAGIVVGPAALGYIDEVVLEQLKLVNGIAIALIALTAGSELDLRGLRPLLKTILAMSLIAVCGGAVAIGVVTWLLRDMIPFLGALPRSSSMAVASVLGVAIAAGSPAVVVAIRKETGADGPVARTTLGVVVVADLIVIIFYAITSTIAHAVLMGEADVSSAAGKVAWEVLGSPIVGVLVGGVLALYVKKVKAGTDYFVLAVCVAIAEVSTRVHLDPLLIALAAGVFVENVTHAGKELVEGFDKASLPVYVLFFTVAGATLHLDALVVVAIPAFALVLTRAGALLVGSRIATSLVTSAPTVKKYAGFGLLPQAGLAIALALTLSRSFPEFGPEATALVLSIVGVNELVAPVLYRWSLVWSGEVQTDTGTETSGEIDQELV